MKVSIKVISSGKKVLIGIQSTDRLEDFQSKVQKATGVPIEDQILTYQSKEFKDLGAITTLKNEGKDIIDIDLDVKKKIEPKIVSEDLVRNKEKLLPKGMNSIKEIKDLYESQKDKKKNKDLCYWELPIEFGILKTSIL